MNICLFISSSKRNTGFGGHYRSLMSYHKQLSLKCNVYLMHHSLISSSILDGKIDNTIKNGIGLIELLKQSKSVLKEKKIDVVLSFSNNLYSSLIRYTCSILNLPFIQIIPGGINRKLPLNFESCIYFSIENIKNKRDYSKKKYLVPNRIDDFNCNIDLIRKLTLIYPKRKLNIVRISRIGVKYYNTFITAIAFHKFLQNQGYDVQTHIVGLIEDLQSYKKLREICEEISNIEIIVSQDFTSDAKLILDYYDISIGIGRGFWESVSKGLIVLGFSNNNKLPIIIDDNIYDLIRRNNFATRTQIESSFSIDQNLDIITNKIKTKEYKEFLYNKFINDYSSTVLGSRLVKIINASKPESTIKVIPYLLLSYVSEHYHITLPKAKSFFKKFILHCL